MKHHQFAELVLVALGERFFAVRHDGLRNRRRYIALSSRRHFRRWRRGFRFFAFGLAVPRQDLLPDGFGSFGLRRLAAFLVRLFQGLKLLSRIS